MKKEVALSFAVLLTIGGFVKAEPVYFADSQLKAVVENALGKTDPNADEMLGLIYLDNVSGLGITSLVGLEYAINLTQLNAYRNQISDLSPLVNLTNLTSLGLSENQISNISAVANLTNLTHLEIGYNSISNISAVSNLTNLVELRLINNNISNISAVANLTNLMVLELRNNNISNISAVSGLTNLHSLRLSGNSISNISALANLTNLSMLMMSSNHISDISALSELTNIGFLDLKSNNISDISPLSSMNSLKSLNLKDNPLNCDAYCIYFPLLQENHPGISLHYDPMPNDCIPDITHLAISPENGHVIVGQQASFTVTASGTEPFTYQWYKDDQPIYNSNNNVLTITSAQLSDAGSYKVDVTNACGSDTSSTAVLTVDTPTLIFVDPDEGAPGQSLTVDIYGENTRFTKGNPPTVWFSNGNSNIFASSAMIISDTLLSANFTIPSDAVEDLWDVHVSDGIDGPLGLAQSFLVVCFAPSISPSGQPQSQSVVIGQNVQFTVQPAGSPPFTYQWQKKDGEEWSDISDAQSATLTINSVQLSDAGEYRAIVTNACNSATSNPAILTVETKYRVSGHVLDWNNQPIGNVKITVGQVDQNPAWEGHTEPDGNYASDEIDADEFYLAGEHRISASLDCDVVTVRDYSDLLTTVEQRRAVNPCGSSVCQENFVFGAAGDRQLHEQDGVFVFHEINYMKQRIADKYTLSVPQVEVWIWADSLLDLLNLGGGYYHFLSTLLFRQNISQDLVTTYHEYGHAVYHKKRGDPYDTESLEEGWSTYFEIIFGPANIKNDHEPDDSYEARWGNNNVQLTRFQLAQRWKFIYGSIFNDIRDGYAQDDDQINGTILHHDDKDEQDVTGEQMVWKVIMEDKAKDIDDFYNKFIARYSQLQDPLFKIYNTHGLYVSTTTTTTGRIPPSQTTTTLARIDSTISKSKFHLSWPVSDLDLTLVDPNGTIIDPCYAASHPDVNYVKTATEAYYSIDNPIPGIWQMKVTAVDVPPEGENYTATAYLTTNLNLLLSTDKQNYEPNELISLTTQLFYDSNSYSDANVTARIERSDGNETIILYDDGLHNDGNSNDGNYANIYATTSVEGQYNIVVTASGWNPFNEPFVRETSRTVQVMRLPDLAAADLQTNDELTQGELILSATIRNNGTAEANDINVAFYDVNDTNVIRIDPNIIIAHLEPNETNTVSVVWNATYGRHQIFVVIDSNNVIAEKDETNNYTSNIFLIDDFDFNFDGITDFTDFAILANKWLDTCTEPAWCDNFDTDRNGQVDILELAKFAQHWLEGI